MKKFFYLLAAFSAALMGCSKSEVVNAPGADTPITFKPYTNRALITKGTEATITDLGQNGFQVYAFSNESTTADGVVAGYGDGKTHTPDKKAYMNKKVFNQDGAGWAYSGFIYWPATYYLDFVAYGLNDKVVETSPTTLKFTVDSDITTHEDLLVAAPVIDVKHGATGHPTDGGTVPFVFSHLLSRISFLLETEGNSATATDNTLVTLEQVDLVGNFYTEGTVDLTQTKTTTLNIGEPGATAVEAERPYITGTTRPAEGLVTYKLFGEDGHFSSYGVAEGGDEIFDNSALYTFDAAEGKIIDQKYELNGVDESTVATTKADRYMMVIPVADWGTKTAGTETYANAKLKVKYFLPGSGSSEVQTVELVTGSPAAPIKFEAGKSYVFKLKVSTWEIGISGEVEVWDESTGVTETFVLG